MDENDVSMEIQEISLDHNQRLPVSQKIDEFSTETQNLKVHTILCNEVKNINADSIPGPEVYDALLFLGIEYETLKKKYLEESELLKKKYLEECLERQRLNNEVIELKGNIRVFCRCRPLNQAEIANGSTSIVGFDSCRENELQIICSDSSKKQFKFDHVFRPGSDQEAVFAQTSPIVTSVLDGYNVCIFAYGQTGTGKTFTMEGTPKNRGVNYRTVEELFRISRERSKIINYELFVSMLEVYNEKIRDLLVEKSNQPPKKLEVKQAAEGIQEVPGLVEARVYGTDEVWGLLQSGSRNRSVGSTIANELSSRSHCLLRVTVKGENLVNGERTSSHLWLVDLAGSERVGRIEAEGERLKESQFINKSLSALGDVISALASKTAHIPYRNSKLTHILQSSLGGDCKTLMFAQISPSAADLGETLCSLNFASRVRGIGCGPVRKQADLSELFKYKQLAEKLKLEEKETKKLQDICRSLQDKVRVLENQLAVERKTRLKQPLKTIAEKKPPLGPSKLKMPLKEISNFLPPPSPIPPHKTMSYSSILPASTDNKENMLRPSAAATKTKSLLQPRRTIAKNKPSLGPSKLRMMPVRRISYLLPPPSPILPASTDDRGNMPRPTAAATNTKSFLQPRRTSISLRLPQTSTAQVLQPKRRVSIETLLPEFNSHMITPLTAELKSRGAMGSQSFVRNPYRIQRISRIFSPLPGSRTASGATVQATPTAMRSCSKFMEAGSLRPKLSFVRDPKKFLYYTPY
ncbi:kinesin-like protein KIN-14S [Vitis riparia]|uniref:kinesin-like protein KIN-14S n=1 Tax=Vitis riparia TaxID=96939 RepID=UPI00155A6EE1|nr:kinesin-like protein KIN-14S [Vitis riparia]XP_034706065.1 kinesin-like protein KIN-14S [Vitis riparia]XP_034706066.1 kinesin-like protein KIN-14S [Vitis riparia]